MNPYLNRHRQLRNGWWILVFFLVLGALLTPLIVISKQHGFILTPGQQAVAVAVASLICQLAHRHPISELVGPLDWRWPLQLLLGCVAGALLMLLPALLLWSIGCVSWRWNDAAGLFPSIGPVAGVPLTEELIFRGFMFQRLIDGLGVLFAQLVCGAYFVLIHAPAP